MGGDSRPPSVSRGPLGQLPLLGQRRPPSAPPHRVVSDVDGCRTLRNLERSPLPSGDLGPRGVRAASGSSGAETRVRNRRPAASQRPVWDPGRRPSPAPSPGSSGSCAGEGKRGASRAPACRRRAPTLCTGPPPTPTPPRPESGRLSEIQATVCIWPRSARVPQVRGLQGAESEKWGVPRLAAGLSVRALPAGQDQSLVIKPGPRLRRAPADPSAADGHPRRAHRRHQLLEEHPSPGWAGAEDWAGVCDGEGPRFDSQSGQAPRWGPARGH